MSEEIAHHKAKIEELNKKLLEKEKELENERSDRQSICHSQEELLNKMKNLQKENDELVVKLEGLNTENEGLLDKNKKLENRVKELEMQNREQLENLNETLKSVELKKQMAPSVEPIAHKNYQTYTKSEKKLKTSSSESTDDDLAVSRKPSLPMKKYLMEKRSSGLSDTEISRSESSKIETQRLNESPLKKISPTRSLGSTITSSPMQSVLGVSEHSQKSVQKDPEVAAASSSKRYLDSVPSQSGKRF